MEDWFGNNASDGYTAKPYKGSTAEPTFVDFNPDHRPSSSAVFYEDRGPDVVAIQQVKGLGVLWFRATTSWANPDGKLKFDGLAIFTKADIGYSPDL